MQHDFIERFVKQNRTYCEQKIIGESEGKRPVYAFSFKKGKGQRKKLLLVSCLHGNEPDTLQTNLKTLENILHDGLLDFWEVMSIPLANPDGKAAGMRYNIKGIDLNRDFVKKEAKETKTIIQAYQQFEPEIVLDYHSNLSTKFSCIILPKNVDACLCNEIIFFYDQIREQTNLATHQHIRDVKYNKIASFVNKGIYKLEQGEGLFVNYASNKSKIAAVIEDYGTDLSLEFSTELLRLYTKR